MIGRAVSSCLNQDFSNLEVIVVDDGSSDGTAGIVEDFKDRRVVLIRHRKNLGVCPARNSGVTAAKGEWLLFLDSDDELVPSSLRTIEERVHVVSDDVHRLVFMYQLETGELSPHPPLMDETWDFRAYLNWINLVRSYSDFFNCIRRSAFQEVAWPTSRASEALFHFEFAKRFLTRCCKDVVALLHSDAENRACNFKVSRRLQDARDMAEAMQSLLQRHGEALKADAFETFLAYLREAAAQSFLAGRRPHGVRYSTEYLSLRPFSFRGWATLLLGLLGPQALVSSEFLAVRLAKSFQRRKH